MAKGAGMIRPDMATMLAFLATDLAVDRKLLKICLGDAVQVSFNAISVDGDTSTNDACVLAAAGTLGNEPLDDLHSTDYLAFRRAVEEVCEEAGLSPEAILEGIRRFAADRPRRLARLRAAAAD